MKLKKFDTTNLPSVKKSGTPAITFQKNGSIRLNNAAMNLMKLEPGSHVVFHQDEESRTDWFMEVVEDKKGFEWRKNKDSLMITNTRLCKELWKSYGMAAASTVRLTINQNPKQLMKLSLWQIISPQYAKAIESL